MTQFSLDPRCAAVLAAMALALLLSGCQPTITFAYPPGGTPRQFYQDMALCRNGSGMADARTAAVALQGQGLGAGLIGAAMVQQADDYIEQCMKGLGYREVPTSH